MCGGTPGLPGDGEVLVMWVNWLQPSLSPDNSSLHPHLSRPGHMELGHRAPGYIRGQPKRVAPAPSIAQAFHQRGVEAGVGGGDQQDCREHKFPIRIIRAAQSDMTGVLASFCDLRQPGLPAYPGKWDTLPQRRAII